MLKRKQRLKKCIFWASTFAFCIYRLKGVCDSFSTQLLLYNTVALTENIRYSCQPFKKFPQNTVLQNTSININYGV